MLVVIIFRLIAQPILHIYRRISKEVMVDVWKIAHRSFKIWFMNGEHCAVLREAWD